jgi:hypothetical protein
MKIAATFAAVLAIAFGLFLYKAIFPDGVDPSFISATLSSVIRDKPVTLDPKKVKNLADWFSRHSSRWGPYVGTFPPANYNLRLRYPGGRDVPLGISRSYSSVSTGAIYVVHTGPFRSLSNKELNELFSILES